MRDSLLSRWVREGFAAIRRILRWRDPDPEDPFAMVTAPTRPGPPSRSARAAAQPER
jgi:hypothetical protein